MWPFDQLRRAERQITNLTRAVARLQQDSQNLREAIGRVESRQLAAHPPATLSDAEFRVYSQWGEDGILDYLARSVAVPRRVFVEFGVEDYAEANTRFLLTQGGWSGLVIDGSEENIARLRRDPIFWRHHLKAVASFITRENINDLLRDQGLAGPIGLLSVDIDGNDYWVWEAITVVEPAVVVVEYNALLGGDRRVTIPYDPQFQRAKAHWSHLYAGASLAALAALGRRKGFSLVGTNRAGNNAFFVREELRPAALPALTAAQAFVPAQFREARDAQGRLSFLPAEEAAPMIADLPWVEVPA